MCRAAMQAKGDNEMDDQLQRDAWWNSLTASARDDALAYNDKFVKGMTFGLGDPGLAAQEEDPDALGAQIAGALGWATAAVDQAALAAFGGELVGGLGEAGGAGETTEAGAEGAETPASTPTGRSGSEMDVEPGTNAPGSVGGRDYTGHAFDQMQGRGIPPSAVENTIQNGTESAGNTSAETVFHDPANNLTVVTDTGSGRVVTVHHGR
jgi:hypothetical protein